MSGMAGFQIWDGLLSAESDDHSNCGCWPQYRFLSGSVPGLANSLSLSQEERQKHFSSSW